jgi:hypothetical protein
VYICSQCPNREIEVGQSEEAQSVSPQESLVCSLSVSQSVESKRRRTDVCGCINCAEPTILSLHTLCFKGLYICEKRFSLVCFDDFP